MDIEKVLLMFGKEYKDKELNDFFKEDELYVQKEIQEYMKTDDYEDSDSDVYAEYPNKGYSLVIEHEFNFIGEGKDLLCIDSSNYYLVCIHFYAQDIDEYNGYKDELINGIKLSHTREEIRELMKEPYKINDVTDAEIWNNVNGFQVYVKYNGQNKPQTIGISLEESEKIKLIEKRKIIENKIKKDIRDKN